VANPTIVEVPPKRVGDYKPNSASYTKESRALAVGANKGKPPGTLNRITRTMKEAAVAAAEELGQLPIKQWAKQLNVGDPNGMKGYFKFLAVKHPKSYAIILARIMPLHVTTGAKKLPTLWRPKGSQTRVEADLAQLILNGAVEAGFVKTARVAALRGRVKPSWSRFGGGAALIERHNIGRVSIVGRDQRHDRLG
jgi:hypothetical protein